MNDWLRVIGEYTFNVTLIGNVHLAHLLKKKYLSFYIMLLSVQSLPDK